MVIIKRRRYTRQFRNFNEYIREEKPMTTARKKNVCFTLQSENCERVPGSSWSTAILIFQNRIVAQEKSIH